MLSDCARTVANHPPPDLAKHGYVRLCCVDCAIQQPYFVSRHLILFDASYFSFNYYYL